MHTEQDDNNVEKCIMVSTTDGTFNEDVKLDKLHDDFDTTGHRPTPVHDAAQNQANALRKVFVKLATRFRPLHRTTGHTTTTLEATPLEPVEKAAIPSLCHSAVRIGSSESFSVDRSSIDWSETTPTEVARPSSSNDELQSSSTKHQTTINPSQNNNNNNNEWKDEATQSTIDSHASRNQELLLWSPPIIKKIKKSRNWCTGSTKLHWQKMVERIKNHPVWCGSCVVSLIVGVSIGILLIVFLVILPNKVQTALDQTFLDLSNAVITKPGTDHFTLFVESQINRNLGTQVILKEFDSSILYTPTYPFQKDYEEKRKINHDDTISHLQNRYLISKAKNEYVPPDVDAPNRNNIDHSITKQRFLQSENMTSYKLGTMQIPNLTISGFFSKTSYTTIVHITDMLLFDTFLKELIRTGSAHWHIVGKPSIEVFGLTYAKQNFEKEIKVKGPKLFITNDDDVAKTKKEHTNNKTADKIKILRVDLSLSDQQIARVHLQLQIDNSVGLTTIDPVGTLTFMTKYDHEILVHLTTNESITLKPRINQLHLFGEFTKVENGSDQRRIALNRFFSELFKGNSVLLETEGVTCSIPLYSSAIESIHVYTALDLSNNDASQRGLPIIKEMEIEELEIVPSQSNEVGITGRVVAIIGNPLGPNALVEIPKVNLVGEMLRPLDNIQISSYANMANFYGTLKGLSESQNVYASSNNDSLIFDHLGLLPVNYQKIIFEMNLILQLTRNGTEFTKFIHSLIHQSELYLSLFNVNATIETKSSMGLLVLKEVPMDKQISMKGFGGLKGAKVVNFSIVGVPFFGTGGRDNTGFPVAVDVMVSSNAAANIYLGDLYVNLMTKGSHLAYLSASNCRIKPGDNYYNFTGTARLADNLGILIPFGTNYMMGRTNVVEVEFIDHIPNNEDQQQTSLTSNATVSDNEEQPPVWLRQAIVGVKISVDLPGAKKVNGNEIFNGRLFHRDEVTQSQPARPQRSRGGFLSNFMTSLFGAGSSDTTL